MTFKLIIEGHKEKDIFPMKEIANRLKNSGVMEQLACRYIPPGFSYVCNSRFYQYCIALRFNHEILTRLCA